MKAWSIFEDAAPGTPQQNGVEQTFATLYIQDRATLNSGKFTLSLRNQFGAQAA